MYDIQKIREDFPILDREDVYKRQVVKTVIPEEARPKLKQVGKIDLDNLNKKTAPKVVEPVAKVIEQTHPLRQAARLRSLSVLMRFRIMTGRKTG